MMRRARHLRLLLICCGAFLAGVPRAAAQTASPNPPAAQAQPVPSQPQSGQRLTLADAQNIAIQNHPQIQAATQLASAAAAEVKKFNLSTFRRPAALSPARTRKTTA